MDEHLPDRLTSDRMQLRISDADRHQVAEILRQAAGEGRIDLDELDERLEATFAARTYADLVPITLDLPDGSAPPATRHAAPQPPAVGTSSERHYAILGGFDRAGEWVVPSSMTIVAVMGGADLDLREATWSGPEATFYVNAVMGGIDIVVPPEVNVIMEGTGILGGFGGPTGTKVPARLTADSPTLRIKGVAIMGGVDVRRKERR